MRKPRMQSTNSESLIASRAEVPPKVSICLPVYNGANYVRNAIRSVMEQSYEDWELVISDNASTDPTECICRELASQDRRVRYFGCAKNRGLAWNHNRAFWLSNGRYVMWLGHDDILHKEYVASCVKALDRDSGAVLCYTNSASIDEDGTETGRTDLKNDGTSDSRTERLRCLLRSNQQCEAIFGLMRREVLKRTRLHGGFAASDEVLLAEMILRGRFQLIPDVLFSRRDHLLQNTRRYTDYRDRTLVFDPDQAGKLILPILQRASAFFHAVSRARLSWWENVRCYQHLVRWLWAFRNPVRSELREALVFAMSHWFSDDEIAMLKYVRKPFGFLTFGQSQRGKRPLNDCGRAPHVAENNHLERSRSPVSASSSR
ncbi:MAG: glycosyltransferase [Planctomycetes bacterium]|nr:glycosyltransferase [Planctomycetota bacterium]